MANGKQVLIPTRYTHEMLSTMTGSTREGVSRAFGCLQNEGAVELRRRQICLKDLESTLPLFTYSRDLMAIGLRERAGGENRRGNEKELRPLMRYSLAQDPTVAKAWQGSCLYSRTAESTCYRQPYFRHLALRNQ
jgi:hypothetical protein